MQTASDTLWESDQRLWQIRLGIPETEDRTRIERDGRERSNGTRARSRVRTGRKENKRNKKPGAISLVFGSSMTADAEDTMTGAENYETRGDTNFWGVLSLRPC